MSFSVCPLCNSKNVNNVHLNLDKYGYPTDGALQGSCLDCSFEEPIFRNKKGNYFYTKYPIGIGNGYVRKEKHKRKRRIARLVKLHAVPLLDKYYNHEHALVVGCRSTFTDKEIVNIVGTLKHYAGVLDRNFDDSSDIFKNNWARSVTDFM